MTDRSEEGMYVRDCARQADNVAEQLERVARRIRELARTFGNPTARGGAAGTAADVVNEFAQGSGSAGTFLWNLIKGAADLDQHRRALAASGDSGGNQ